MFGSDSIGSQEFAGYTYILGSVTITLNLADILTESDSLINQPSLLVLDTQVSLDLLTNSISTSFSDNQKSIDIISLLINITNSDNQGEVDTLLTGITIPIYDTELESDTLASSTPGVSFISLFDSLNSSDILMTNAFLYTSYLMISQPPSGLFILPASQVILNNPPVKMDDPNITMDSPNVYMADSYGGEIPSGMGIS